MNPTLPLPPASVVPTVVVVRATPAISLSAFSAAKTTSVNAAYGASPTETDTVIL